MRLRSFKLRFAYRHVRIEIEGETAGVDLVDEAADAAFALAGPLRERVPAARALSLDLATGRLLASLEPEGAFRLEGVAPPAAMLAHLEEAARASLARRYTTIRAAPGAARIDEWALVLAAVGIEPRALPDEAGWALAVAPADAAAARAALDAYDEENAPQPLAAPPDYGETLLGPVFALLVSISFLVLDPERGAAEAERILRGEWWRTVTALTLHADAAHAAGNAFAGAILLSALAGRLGPAAAAWATLAAGVAGNALTALVHRRHFVSIGASTSVFGALGALAGAQLLTPRPRKRWLPVAAAAALLGSLGTGARADLSAHLSGALIGFALGAAAAALLRQPPRRSALQPLLAAASLLVPLACWKIALR